MLSPRVSLRQAPLHISPNWCILCKNHVETGEHLFISCNHLQFFWAHFFGYLNSNSTSPQNVEEAINLHIAQKNASK